MLRIVFLLLFVSTASLLTGQVSLLSNVAQNPSFFTQVGNVAFFRSGVQLWKTDGTPAGTVLVRTMSGPLREFTDVNGTLFFLVNDPTTGRELWKSDGTQLGTERVKVLLPGAPVSLEQPMLLTNVNGLLLFVSDDGIHGRELWRSDGSEAGTFMVMDLRPGSEGSSPEGRTSNGDGFAGFPIVGANIFFTAITGASPFHRSGLWKSDGTPEGTVLIREIGQPGWGGIQSNFAVLNGAVYFAANDAPVNINGALVDQHGWELWKSDGSTATMVVDAWQGVGSTLPEHLLSVNGRVFYQATHPSFGRELWTSDGTGAGTGMLKDINSTPVGGANPHSVGSAPQRMIAVNGLAMFIANDGTNGFEVWRSDGTESGTFLTKSDSTSNNPPQMLTNVGERLFYRHDGGAQIYTSDGTTSGTFLLREAYPSMPLTPNTGVGPLGALGSNLLFADKIPNVANQNLFPWGVDVLAILPGPPSMPGIEVARGVAKVPSEGSTTVGGSVRGISQSLVFSITNPGTSDLSIAGVILGNHVNCAAVLTATPLAVVPPLAVTWFEVQVTPTEPGSWSFVVDIVSNVTPPSYTITVEGNAAQTSAQMQLQRAVYTVDSLGSAAPGNKFALREDVYLDGDELADGNYYVRVTMPNGTVLGTSVGATNSKPIAVVGGEFVSLYQLWGLVRKASDGQQGFDQTNNSGAYRVQVSPSSSFPANQTATIIFKADE